MLTAFPGAPAAPEGTFTSAPDAHDWTVSLLDDILARVDDALADAKHVGDQKRTLEIGATQPSTSNAAVEVATAPAIAATATAQADRAPAINSNTNQGYVSYMQSTLKQKPQYFFATPMDNSNAPFIHNLENIKDFLIQEQGTGKDGSTSTTNIEDIGAAMAAATAAGTPPPHPLQSLLENLEYPEWQLKVPEIAHQYKSFEETHYHFIDTITALEALSLKLGQSSEIAVDLEAHNYRSFQGFCCLMQLSTREEDFIIDVLVLRQHVGRYLAPLFANPRIVKILHGSDGDIVWLQRDFGIYVCNLFDTGQAARVLDYEGHGLGYMMERLCDFKADKRWQLADWRLRPLSAEAIHYARADTHYLFHCYDRVRQELATRTMAAEGEEGEIISPHVAMPLPEKNPGGALGIVLERSRQICLHLYEKEQLRENSYLTLYEKINKNFSDEQLSVFSALYSWRDRVARQEDESLGYILSRNQLIALCEALPITVAELSRTLGRGAALLQSRAKEVLSIMAAAREDPTRIVLQKKVWMEKMATRPVRRGARGGDRGVMLPDMAVAAAAAAAALPPPSPPPPEGEKEALNPANGSLLLKPKAVGPLVGGLPSAVVGAPAATEGLKPRKIVLRGSNGNTVMTNGPKLGVASASSLFGSLLAEKSSCDGVLATTSSAAPVDVNLGYGAVLPPTNFGSRGEIETIRQIEETQEHGQRLKETTATEKKNAVSVAIEKLSAGQAAEDRKEKGEVVAAEKKKDDTDDELEDFLPLALSDKYNLTKKRKRRQQLPHYIFGGDSTIGPAAAAAAAAGGGGGGGGSGKKQKSGVGGRDSQKVKNTMKQLGLEGEEDGREAGAAGEEDSGNGAAAAEVALAPVDYAAAAAKYDMGIVDPHRRGGRGGRGARGGRGRRGRGGRGSGGGRKGKGDNPAGIPDVTGLKGGKRSAVHVRSGNRSSR